MEESTRAYLKVLFQHFIENLSKVTKYFGSDDRLQNRDSNPEPLENQTGVLPFFCEVW